MNTILNRKRQLEMLLELANSYPQRMDVNPTKETTANLIYLEEHGLVKNIATKSIDHGISVHSSTITAQGMDFLSDDGGLSAILKVVDVRLHADTIKELINIRIQSSELPEAEKSALSKHLQHASQSSLSHLTNKLIDLGLQNANKALQIIQTLPDL